MAVMATLGVLLLLAVLVFSFLLPLSPGRMSKPSAALIGEWSVWSWIASLPFPNLESPWPVAVLLLTSTLLALTVYALAILVAWHHDARPSGVRLAFFWALLLFTINALALPNLNRNIYNYMVRGRVAAAHGANPYVAGAAQFPDDPILEYADGRYTHGLSGKLPAWMLLNIGLARLAGDDPVTNLFVYRFALLLLNAGCLAMIATILRRHRPQHLITGIVVFGWNPIVIMYGQSKTDIFMVFLLLVATALLLANRKRWAVIPLTLSVFVKLFTLPLLLAGALREVRLRRWRELAVGLLLVAATSLAVYAPFWNAGESNLFLHHMGAAAGGGRSGTASAAGLLLKAAFLLLIIVVGVTRKRDDWHLLQGWTLILLFFSLFVAKFASADYLMTLIAILALTLDWRVVLVAVPPAGSSLLSNLWNVTFTSDFTVGDAIPISKELIYLAIPCLGGVVALAIWGCRRVLRRREQRGVPAAPGGSQSPQPRLNREEPGAVATGPGL